MSAQPANNIFSRIFQRHNSILSSLYFKFDLILIINKQDLEHIVGFDKTCRSRSQARTQSPNQGTLCRSFREIFFRNCCCSSSDRSPLSSQSSILCQVPTPTIITYNPQRRRLPRRFSPLRSRNPQNNHRFAQPTVFYIMVDNNDNVVFGQFHFILQCNIFCFFLFSSYVGNKTSWISCHSMF